MKNGHRFAPLCLEELEGRLAPAALLSTNWSGYAVEANAGSVTSVSASWVVPAVTGTGNGYSAAWVGIDGLTSRSVEQIGTSSEVHGSTPLYYAWFEMYPAPAVAVNLPVHPGDSVSARVSYASGAFTLEITDGTQTFSTTRSDPSAQRSSAEWIQEAPSSASGVLPLANFGTIGFSRAQATIDRKTGPIDNSTPSTRVAAITMVSPSGTAQATASALTDSGSPATSSFTVTALPAKAPPHQVGASTSQAVSRQNDLTPSTATPAGTLDNGLQLTLQALRTATAQSAVVGTPLGSASISSGSLGQLGPSPASGLTFGTFSVGGSGDPSAQAPAPPSASEPSAPALPQAPAPSLPLPPQDSPLEQSRDSGASAEGQNGIVTPLERTGALLEPGEEDSTPSASGKDLGFLLGLAGAWSIGLEKAATRWRQRPLR